MLLSRYSGEADVVFGITVDVRPKEWAQGESLVGLYVNTVPVRGWGRVRGVSAELPQEVGGAEGAVGGISAARCGNPGLE